MMLTVTWEAALTACASRQFADKMSAAGPYQSMEACIGTARRIWWQEVGVEGWLEAFAAHPEIGDAGATLQADWDCGLV
jgi:5-hydroxyisourate hydrolase/2-oxo-4-hydroxy-4-carboxy-5-ureidoimidazoline decarboxylase